MRPLLLPLTAALCLVAVDARAHADALPLALDVLTGAPDALTVEATFGLLVLTDGGDWRWLCHETIARPQGILIPRYVRNGDGVLLATLGVRDGGQVKSESLYRSADDCDWGPAGGTTGRLIADVAFDPADDSLALAVSGGLGDGVTNSILRSTDAGATFGPTSVADVDRLFEALAAAL